MTLFCYDRVSVNGILEGQGIVGILPVVVRMDKTDGTFG